MTGNYFHIVMKSVYLLEFYIGRSYLMTEDIKMPEWWCTLSRKSRPPSLTKCVTTCSRGNAKNTLLSVLSQLKYGVAFLISLNDIRKLWNWQIKKYNIRLHFPTNISVLHSNTVTFNWLFCQILTQNQLIEGHLRYMDNKCISNTQKEKSRKGEKSQPRICVWLWSINT